MGTRSLTHIIDKTWKPEGVLLLTIYRQFDGYPGGMGKELAEFLDSLTVVNGLSGDTKRVANGAGCLAAQLVKALKDDAGNVYIQSPGASDCGEEYTYHIEVTGPLVTIRCDDGKPMEAAAFLKWIERTEKEEA